MVSPLDKRTLAVLDNPFQRISVISTPIGINDLFRKWKSESGAADRIVTYEGPQKSMFNRPEVEAAFQALAQRRLLEQGESEFLSQKEACTW